MASGITAREPERGTTLPPAPAVGELSPGEGKSWELNHRKHQCEIIHRFTVTGHKRMEALGLCYTLQCNTKVEEKPLPSSGLRCTPGNTSAPGPASAVSFWGLGDMANLEELQAQLCRERGIRRSVSMTLQLGRTGLVSNTYTHSYTLRTVKRL